MRVVGSFVRGLIAFFSIAVAMTLAEALLHQVCDAGTKTPTGLCRSEHAVGLIEDYVREIMAGMAEDDPAREFLHYQYLFQFDQNLEEAANVDNILIPYWDRMMQKSSEEVEKRELPVDPDFDVCCESTAQ